MAVKLKVKLEGDNTNLNKKIKETDKAVKKLDKSASKTSSALGSIGQVAGGFLAARAIGFITSALGGALKEALNFEEAISEINTLLPVTQKLSKDLVRVLEDLSVEFGTSKTEQAKSFYQVVSAGITNTAKAMEVLTAANNLALGGVGNVETAILGITKVLNNYGDKAGSAAEISDVLFTAVKNGQTRIDEFAGELPKVLAISEQLGLGFENTAAALTTLTNKSENTSVAATELRALLSSLVKNQDVLSKITDKAGNSFSVEQLRVKGLTTFLKDLREATGDTVNLQKALGGRIQSLNAVLKLSSGNWEALEQNIKDFNNSQGAATKAADEMNNTLGKLSGRTGSAIVDFFSTLISKGGVLRTVLEGVNTIFSGLRLLVKDDNSAEQLSKLVDSLSDLQRAEQVLKGKSPLQQRFAFLDGNRIGKSLGQVRKEIAGVSAEIDAIASKGLKDRIDPTIAANDALLALEAEKKLGDAKKASKKLLDDELLLLDDEFIIASKEKRDARITQLDEENIAIAEKELADRAQTLEALGQHEEAIALIKDAARKKELISLNAQKKKEKKIVVLTETEKKAILQSSLSQIASLQASENKAAIAVGKAAGIANVIISTEVGAMKAFELGPIVGPPLAAAIIAAGALSAGRIAGVKGFADGGVIGGISGATAGADNAIATVRTGEMVLNAGQQEQLFEAINGGELGGGGDVRITIDAGMFTDAIEGEFVTRSRENRTAMQVG